MKEHPILFSGPLVRAILAGTKTVTRRPVTRWPVHHYLGEQADGTPWLIDEGHADGSETYVRCPFGVPGDRLYVRETWTNCDSAEPCVRYRADGHASASAAYAGHGCECVPHQQWRPSIHMPRWASRLTLEVTAVRVERLQDIAEEDAVAEGVPCWYCGGRTDGTSENDCACFHTKREARTSFQAAWDDIYGKRAGHLWTDNPFVWRVAFRRLP